MQRRNKGLRQNNTDTDYRETQARRERIGARDRERNSVPRGWILRGSRSFSRLSFALGKSLGPWKGHGPIAGDSRPLSRNKIRRNVVTPLREGTGVHAPKDVCIVCRPLGATNMSEASLCSVTQYPLNLTVVDTLIA